MASPLLPFFSSSSKGFMLYLLPSSSLSLSVTHFLLLVPSSHSRGGFHLLFFLPGVMLSFSSSVLEKKVQGWERMPESLAAASSVVREVASSRPQCGQIVALQ